MIENTINYSFNASNIGFSANNLSAGATFKEVCELNQYAMLQQTQQMPNILFYILVFIGFLMLIEIMVLPRLEKYTWLDPFRGWFMKTAAIIMPAPLFITYLLTYRPTPEFMTEVFNPILMLVIGLLICLAIWDYRKILMELYQAIKNPPKDSCNLENKNIENLKEEKKE